MDISLVSWNIAGGRLNKSSRQFDYTKVYFDYFAKKILHTYADIVCIQEMESDKENFSIRKYSDLLKMKNFYFVPSHTSPFDNKNLMGNVIFSRYEMSKRLDYTLPNPNWDLFWPDGKPVKKFVKKIIACTIKGINIANLHLEPLGLWGFNYYEEPGLSYAKQIERLMLKIPGLDVFCGDFSGDFRNGNIKEIFDSLFSNNKFRDSLPNQITRPLQHKIGGKNDHIFVSNKFSIKESKIIPTNSDHYLCYAKISTI